jgi:hypothetical protein
MLAQKGEGGPLDTDLSITVPERIQRVSAYFIDVLTPSQIFALKMASCICIGKGHALGAKNTQPGSGNEFRIDILENIHNIAEYQSRLQDDLNQLASLRIITIKHAGGDEKKTGETASTTGGSVSTKGTRPSVLGR